MWLADETESRLFQNVGLSLLGAKSFGLDLNGKTIGTATLHDRANKANKRSLELERLEYSAEMERLSDQLQQTIAQIKEEQNV